MIDRVVSLAPSATATIAALGASDRLVGVTHACPRPGNWGGGDEDAPSIVGGWPNPDLDAVAALNPEIVLTCDALQRETVEGLRDRGVRVAHAEPTRLADVFEYVEAVGAAVGVSEEGERLAARLRDRVDRVRETVPDDAAERPVVYAEEWGDPPMAAGNWVPDAVTAAGGQCPFVEAGERSCDVDRDTVEAAAPDHVFLHWCGANQVPDERTLAERGWTVDAAVHVVDDDVFNQPSPRLVDGIELLARTLHGVDVGPHSSE